MSLFKSIGKIFKPITDVFSGGNIKTAQINSKPFNLDKESKPAQQIADQQRLLAEQRQQQANAGQNALVQQLQGQAAGTAPSLAEAQLRSAGDRSLASQLAAASAQRGGSVGARQKNLMNAQQATGRDINQQAVEARLAEQGQARQQLGGLLAQQQASADQAVNQYLQLGYDFATATKMAQQQMALAQAGMQQQTNMAKGAQQSALLGGLLGGASSAGAAAIMASDERVKTNIKPGKDKVKSFLDALNAREYEYKDASIPGAAPGKRVGIMAQDLEKSEMGKALVLDTPTGKKVDTVQGFGAVLAAQSELHKRLSELEKRKKA